MYTEDNKATTITGGTNFSSKTKFIISLQKELKKTTETSIII